MKKFASIVVAILIVATTSTLSFAKEKQAAGHEPRVIKLAEEKIPQIIQFSSSWSGANQDGKGAHDSAIKQANEWLKANYKHIKLISHSVSGNSGMITDDFYFYASGIKKLPTSSTGFSTVTILYQEK